MEVDDENEARSQPEDGRLHRAIRLFEFLARIQQIKSATPRTLDGYERDGDVVWLHSLPVNPAIRTMHRHGGVDPTDPILTIDRIPHISAPLPPETVSTWLADGFEDPSIPPALKTERIRAVDVAPTMDGDREPDQETTEHPIETEYLAQHPEVTNSFDHWLSSWSSWAEGELVQQPIRELYARLFSIHIASTTHPEDLEVICASACLGWKPHSHDPVQRHTFVTSAIVRFDDSTGRLTVQPVEATDTISLELDMLNPDMIRDPQRINEIRDSARSVEAHPLDREAISLLGRRLVHTLDSDGQYLDEDVAHPVGSEPVISYAPAVILRKRSRQGLIQVFMSIASQMRKAESVPEGLLPLVDPNHQPDPGLSWEGDEGGMVEVDEEVFLPLPVNKAQLQVIKRVDKSAQILVQGPPGTGKTHTAAALISHLLAQGKRVLVTAQTDRALKEVREKLPEKIKPLSVAVVGTGREDMADLKTAVERIANAATEHDSKQAENEIDRHLREVDELRKQRSSVHHQLIEAREDEVRSYDRPGINGTLAAIALDHENKREKFDWLANFDAIEATSDPPLTNLEVQEWWQLLLSESLRTDETEAGKQLAEPHALRSPEDFSDLVLAEGSAVTTCAAFSDVNDSEAFGALVGTTGEFRSNLHSNFRWLVDEAVALSQRAESWMVSALDDVVRQRTTPWRARRNQIATLIGNVQPLLAWLGPELWVTCPTDLAVMVQLATSLRSYLADGGKIKVDGAGQPRLGTLTNRVLRDARPLFSGVAVDGMPPTSVTMLDSFLTWARAERIIEELDRSWPDGTVIPPEDTQSERLYWHVAELEQLERALALAARINELSAALAALGLRHMNWADLDQIRNLGRVIDAIESQLELDAVQVPLLELENVTKEAARWRNAAQCVMALEESVRSRSVDGYGRAWDRLHELLDVRALADRRDELSARLKRLAPNFAAQVQGQAHDPNWREWLGQFEEAWRWAATGCWITDREQVDVNLLQRQLDAIEERIRDHVEELAAERAWQHAVSPARMTGQSRADLEQYVQLVRSHGKGTSVKYGSQRRAEIKTAMDRCRPSVPVWILPIYKVVEQIRIAPDIFDVVIVDEASQAGLEATFLQYLAPKIVVIGDDKQVSPSAVGIDQQQLRDLANQYLYDDRYKASWQNPLRSLFDEAKMRYGGTITLVEHRRCVPEIIGFSNRVAYQPDGIRLIPVRQYGVDRLEPIKTVFLPEGYTRGSTTRVNPVECDAVVDQVEKCLADPAYDGLTFGVISLQGTAQARAIEKALLDRIAPEEWKSRDLRCGDSADFQGSERNVTFLSMVASSEPDRRLMPLTQLMYLQRYNVAASRAKDQLWLFHSVALAELNNTEDLRFQLLDYCYGIASRTAQVDNLFSNPVPEDVKVRPFDSLFEQRVFNILIDRGYNVVPQFEVEGYSIDLVIVGSRTKVAIECDGDYWHGPDRYEADLARKRDLERNGWNFFNVRESFFYVDRAAALAPLWNMLASLEVHPSGWIPPSEPDSASGPGRRDPVDPREEESGLAVDLAPRRNTLDLAEVRSFVSSDEKAIPQEVAWPTEDDDALGEDEDGSTSEFAEPLHEIVPSAEPDPPAVYALSLPNDLVKYQSYSGRTTPPLDATRTALVSELVAIVEVEGPVLGERLHQAHVRASGGQRVGRQIAHALNSAITQAKNRGLLIEENPLSEAGVKPRTYRIASQPQYIVRDLGPRTLEQVPPQELAAVVAGVASERGWSDEEGVFRAVLELYKLRRLTTNAVTHLRRIKTLAVERQE